MLLLLNSLCWVVVMPLLSIVKRLRPLSTLPLPELLLLLLRGMTRHSAYNLMYERAQVASMWIGS